MRKFDIALLAGIIISIIVGSFSGFSAECAEVRDSMVRLHVLANSDSREDQELKYRVRDTLLSQSEELFSGSGSKLEAEHRIQEKLAKIEELANLEIEEQGFSYPVKTELVNMYFETREYDGITVPAGRYDAVRITIGAGEGKNWWCVMFPPMCVPAAMDAEEYPMERQIQELGTQPQYKPKFAVVELIESIKNKLAGNPEITITEAELEFEPELGILLK